MHIKVSSVSTPGHPVVFGVKSTGSRCDLSSKSKSKMKSQNLSHENENKTLLRWKFCSAWKFNNWTWIFLMSQKNNNKKKTSSTIASLRKLQVAYNDAMWLLLRTPCWCSASKMFVAAGVNTLQATMRHSMHEFKCRLNCSENWITMALTSIKLAISPRYGCNGIVVSSEGIDFILTFFSHIALWMCLVLLLCLLYLLYALSCSYLDHLCL